MFPTPFFLRIDHWPLATGQLALARIRPNKINTGVRGSNKALNDSLELTKLPASWVHHLLESTTAQSLNPAPELIVTESRLEALRTGSKVHFCSISIAGDQLAGPA